MKLFPAVLIGGPFHSGKSVLAYSLTQALRQHRVEHYVLRAYPDGEGDWSNEAEPATVRAIRVKGEGSPEWIARICRDIRHRHLPLIVDVGGKPTSWQEAVFDDCTHAILLTPDEASRKQWQEMMARHGVPLLADLRSALEGESRADESQAVLQGTLIGLHRGTTARGSAFDALVDRLAKLFDYPTDELRQVHLDSAPVETVVELDRLKRTLEIGGDPTVWEPASLPQVVDYLPPGVPLGLYGRGPNWLYAALALLAHPAELRQFDVRLGWVLPAPIKVGRPSPYAPLQVAVYAETDYTRLEFSLPRAYIDYLEAEELFVPLIPLEQGVVLSGKLPHWLLTGLALAYRQARWLAVFQPPLGGAVVVHSQGDTPAVGSILPC
jgi:CRISPR-associated protein Csx3